MFSGAKPTEQDMEAKKTEFLEHMRQAYGIVAIACEKSGIGRTTYYRWRDTDVEFAQAVDDILQTQGDFVESNLLRLIEHGDTSATIFYCKTKLKSRGYTERDKPSEPTGAELDHPLRLDGQEQKAASCQARTSQSRTEESESLWDDTPLPAAMKRRIKQKKDYLVKLLKKQGRYTPELSMQVSLLAQLLVKTDLLAARVLSEGHRPINVEISREGNTRQSVSALERLYMDYVRICQSALRATGMNKDSREKLTGDDGMSDFLKQLEE